MCLLTKFDQGLSLFRDLHRKDKWEYTGYRYLFFPLCCQDFPNLQLIKNMGKPGGQSDLSLTTNL